MIASIDRILAEELVNHLDPTQPPRRGNLIEGTVLEVGKHGAIVDLGGKSDAIVPPRELGSGLQVGDRAGFVVIEGADDSDGVKLSRRLAQLWQELDWAQHIGETVTVQVTGTARKHGKLAGARVKYKKKGVSGFVPASLLGQKVEDKDADLIGQELRVKVREVEMPEHLIFDHRQVEQDVRAAELSPGQVLDGVVKSIATTADGAEFGLFVDIGGARGLVHRSEIGSTQPGDTPLSQRYVPGQRLEVLVLGVTERGGKKAIALSIKKLTQKRFMETLVQGVIVEATVAKEAPYGYFLNLTADGSVQGLVHRSQLGWATRTGKRALRAGDAVRARVESIDREALRVSLSMRDVAQAETA